MDPLSLLCELHADGRATAQKLRSQGIDSLQALARKDPQELAGALKVPPRAAKKILAEARDMLQGSFLEPQIADRVVSSPRPAIEASAGLRPSPFIKKQDQSFKSQVLDLVAQRFR